MADWMGGAEDAGQDARFARVPRDGNEAAPGAAFSVMKSLDHASGSDQPGYGRGYGDDRAGSPYIDGLQAAEVLPPDGKPPRQRSQWASAPATYLLGGINIAVFLIMCISGVSITSPTPEQLLHWGANYGPFVLVLGQWWRLVTATFVHVGLLHLATNMWCLWNLGLLGEPLLGGAGLVGVYILTGFGGNLLSTALHPGLGNSASAVGAGASGSVFGIAGVLIVLLGSKLLPLPEFEVKRLRKSVIWFAALNFVLGAGTWVAHTSIQIDNFAHLGGFLTGLALALPLVPRIGVPRVLFDRRRRLSLGGGTFVLLLLAFGVRAFYLNTAR